MKGTGFRTTDEGFNKTPSGNHPKQERALVLIWEAIDCLEDWATEHQKAGCDDETCRHEDGQHLALTLELILMYLKEATEPFPEYPGSFEGARRAAAEDTDE